MPLVNLMTLDRSIDGGLARRVREIRERSIHHGDFDVLDRLADALDADLHSTREEPIGGCARHRGKCDPVGCQACYDSTWP